jgi:cytochrome P450
MGIVDFEFMPFGEVKDPYPTYARMRDAGRVLKTPLGALLVHRYEDVKRAHGDHDSFSVAAMAGVMGPMMGGGGGGGGGKNVSEGMGGDEFMLAQTMFSSDPPDHERLRRVVSRAFTPRSITALEGRVREISRDLLAPLAKGEPFDIVADFAAPLPTIVIAELLGVPAEDASQFRVWSEAVTGTDMRRTINSDTSARYGLELRRYLAKQINQRKETMTDDLIGRMVEANQDGSMSDAEVVASCVLLLIAGNETTMRLISNMILALSRHPDQLDRLIDDPELIPSAVEETLRYDSPVQMLFRATKDDVVFGDVEVGKGSFMLTMLAAANRDPEAFKESDVYDVGRTDNLHVSFGHGIHYCLGAPLARRETRIAFEELFDVVPSFKLLTTDDELEYPAMGFLRSPRSLVIQAA